MIEAMVCVGLLVAFAVCMIMSGLVDDLMERAVTARRIREKWKQPKYDYYDDDDESHA